MLTSQDDLGGLCFRALWGQYKKKEDFINCETFCLKKVMDTKNFHIFKKIYNFHPITCNSCNSQCAQYEPVVFTSIEMKAVNFAL